MRLELSGPAIMMFGTIISGPCLYFGYNMWIPVFFLYLGLFFCLIWNDPIEEKSVEERILGEEYEKELWK